MLINKRESVGLKYFDDPKAFIEYSIDKDDIHKNIDKYKLNKTEEILIVFGDMIVNLAGDKNL